MIVDIFPKVKKLNFSFTKEVKSREHKFFCKIHTTIFWPFEWTRGISSASRHSTNEKSAFPTPTVTIAIGLCDAMTMLFVVRCLSLSTPSVINNRIVKCCESGPYDSDATVFTTKTMILNLLWYPSKSFALSQKMAFLTSMCCWETSNGPFSQCFKVFTIQKRSYSLKWILVLFF